MAFLAGILSIPPQLEWQLTLGSWIEVGGAIRPFWSNLERHSEKAIKSILGMTF